MMIKKFKLKSFKKKSGVLIPIEFDRKLPIKIKRIFYIYGKKNYVRADHAHKKCSQLFIPILGKVELTYINKRGKGIKDLNHKNKEMFLLKPYNWCKIKFMSKNVILMVVCDRVYEFNDYIENYSDFLKSIK